MTSNSAPPPEDVVREILLDWDPEGLLEMGAPEDEYDPEVERVVKHLSEIETPEEMIDLLRAVFSHMFARDYAWDECKQAGNELFRRLELPVE